MSVALSKKLQRLDDFLLSEAFDEDAMLLSELDGFLAGVAVSPGLILPSEWLPVVWGGEEPLFENEHQARSVVDLIMGHYNDIIRQLDRGGYGPVYDFDRDDTILWETWMAGFGQAIQLRPEAWLDFAEADDEDLQQVLFCLFRLREIATTPRAELAPLEIDEELEDLAPDIIPHAVETLHGARRALATASAAPANENRPKVGRNDPCPCGSGKKFKKCCLNQGPPA